MHTLRYLQFHFYYIPIRNVNSFEAGIVVQQVKAVFAMPFSHVGVLLQILAALLQIPLSPNVSGKAVKDGSNAWAPATRVENCDGVPGS